MDEFEIEKAYQEMESRGLIAPLGECEYCDKQRSQKIFFFPAHRAYDFCRSYKGGRNHCTCDTCF